MADRIKGITIEIGGDTTKLSKALQGVNKDLRETKTQLRDLDKLLKVDPGNTKLLQQKYEAMGKAVADSKKKLEQLQEAEKQMQAEGKTDTAEWDALQREIEATKQEMERLTASYKEFGSVQTQQIAAAGENIKATGDKISDAGKALLPVTAAIGAVGAASLSAAKEMDEGYDTIITKTGATGEALEDLTDQMDDVFSSIPTDAAAAGTAIGEVNTRFGLTGDALEDLSKQFIEFSEINETDLNTSIDSVDSIMIKFGVDAKETGNVLGLMTKAGQDTGLSMDTLYSSLEKNGATLKEMGLGLTESVNLLAQFEASGVESSTALAALRKAQQNAVSEGRNLSDVLTEQVTAIQSASTETEALQIATDLFGKKGAAEMTQAIREGRFSIDDLNASLSDYKDTVNSTYMETLDPWDQMTMATNNLKVAGSELASAWLTALAPVIQSVTDGIRSLTEWFTNLDEGQQQMIAKIAMVVAAVGPVLIVIGKVISAVGSIMTLAPQLAGVISTVSGVATTLGGVLSSLWATLLANPIVLIVAAIAGLVAAFVHFWNTSEEFRNFWIGLWDSIKTAVTGAIDTVKTTVTNGLNSIKTTVSSVLDGIKSKFTEVWNSAKSIVSGAINTIKGLMNFTWSLPKLKLPHFNISGKFSLDPPSMPKIGVEWYAKAMEDGMILNSPTIFGAANGSLLGGGEAGAEAVVGVGSLQSMITGAVAAAGGGGDIIIPVYVGQERIDEIVVNATQRTNYRSGGR